MARRRTGPVDDLVDVRAGKLTVRADTIRSMRHAVADLIEGARLEGWPLESVNFADRARKDLGNAEAVLRARIADLVDPLDSGRRITFDAKGRMTINLRGDEL